MDRCRMAVRREFVDRGVGENWRNSMDFHILLLGLVVGIATGLRTMTGLAVISLAAHAGWMNLKDSPLSFFGSLGAVVILTAGAVGEYVADKLPRTGKRTALAPLIARIIAGSLCGAAVCFASAQSWRFGAALGAMGAIIGSFAGYYVRVGLVRKLQVADILIAVPEDLVAIGLSALVVSRL
jgi:uncharacterized membrane protein